MTASAARLLPSEPEPDIIRRRGRASPPPPRPGSAEVVPFPSSARSAFIAHVIATANKYSRRERAGYLLRLINKHEAWLRDLGVPRDVAVLDVERLLIAIGVIKQVVR